MTTYLLVLAYLAAIVAANLLAVELGPEVTIYTAFALIGLDLTLRDRLHDRWEHDRLALRMGALIAAGSALSFLANRDAGRIALASMVAFALAAAVDALVYYWRRRDRWLERSNASNVAGALVDSLVFPTLAFSAWLPEITFGQFTAKVAGGLVWTLVIAYARDRASSGVPPSRPRSERW